jgi:hypothetical protein
MFDVDTFLNTPISEPMSTRYTIAPEGIFMLQIEDVSAASGTSDNGPWLRLDITYTLTDPSVLDALNTRRLIVRGGRLFLDLNPDGSLDLRDGRNVRLGKLRDAVKQNTRNQPWSPSMLKGQMVAGQIRHSPSRNDPNEPIAEVVRVFDPSTVREFTTVAKKSA